MAMTEAVKENLYFRRLFEELGMNELIDTTIYNDNLEALKLAENPILHNRSKHIDLRFHFIREAIHEKLVNIEYLSTNSMLADILTKALTGPKLRQLISGMGLREGLIEGKY